MPTVFTHGIIGLTAGHVCLPEDLQEDSRVKRMFIGLSVVVPIVPDLDGLFLPFISYAHPLGHRGLSHSIIFAVFLGALAAGLMIMQSPALKARWVWLVTYFSILTASHGLLDAMTSGGLGIAFFAPFDNHRYFFPVRPIPASPILPSQFVSRYGLNVMIMELLLIWTVCCALLVIRRKLMSVTLLLGSGVASLVRMIEQRYKLTTAALLLLAALLWVIRSV
jgi:inner membrane protein